MTQKSGISVLGRAFLVGGLLFLTAGRVWGEGPAPEETAKKGKDLIERVVQECSKIRSGWVEFGGVELSKNPFPEEGGEEQVQHFSCCHWGKYIFDEERGGLYAETWVRRMNDAPLADAKRLMTGDPYQNVKGKSNPPEESLSVLQGNPEYFASYQESRLSRRPAPVEERVVPQLHLWPAEKRIRELTISPRPVDPRACGLVDQLSLDFSGNPSISERVRFQGDHLLTMKVQKVSDEGGLMQVEMSDARGTIVLTVDVGKGYRPVRLVRTSHPSSTKGNVDARVESQVTWVEMDHVWVPKTFRHTSYVVDQKLPVQDLTIEYRWKDVNRRIDFDVFEFHSLEVVQKGSMVMDRRGLRPKLMGLWDGKGRLAPYPDEVGEEVLPKELKVVPPEIGQ